MKIYQIGQFVKTNPNKANFTSYQRPAIAARCRISARGPLFSIHERDQIYRSLRLLIDPGCPWRRGDCIKQPPVLKEASGNKEHFIACWKCQRKLIIDKYANMSENTDGTVKLETIS
jgi:hypothetical protein